MSRSSRLAARLFLLHLPRTTEQASTCLRQVLCGTAAPGAAAAVMATVAIGRGGGGPGACAFWKTVPAWTATLLLMLEAATPLVGGLFLHMRLLQIWYCLTTSDGDLQAAALP